MAEGWILDSKLRGRPKAPVNLSQPPRIVNPTRYARGYGFRWHGALLRRPALLGPARLDLNEVVSLAAIHSRAGLMRSVPGVGRAKDVRPKRPSAALQRPDRIDAAHRLSIGSLQKDAVAVLFLSQAVSKAHAAEMLLAKPVVRATQELGNSADFLFRGPNVSRFATAAVAALGTLEAETGLVPLLSRHRRCPEISEVLRETRSRDRIMYWSCRPVTSHTVAQVTTQVEASRDLRPVAAHLSGPNTYREVVALDVESRWKADEGCSGVVFAMTRPDALGPPEHLRVSVAAVRALRTDRPKADRDCRDT